MNDSLRPLNLGAILDRGIQIFREQPLVFLGLAAIPGVVQMVASAVNVRLGPKVTLFPGSTLVMIVFEIAQLILRPMSNAALCLAASRINLGGTATVRDTFSTFRSRKGRLVGLAFLQGIFAGWPFLIAFFVAAGIAALVKSPGMTFYLILIIGGVPCCVLYARYAIAFPATAIEDLSASLAIDRSVALSKGGRTTIFAGILLTWVPSVVLTLGSFALVSHLQTHSPLLAGSPISVAFINAVDGFILTLLFSPYSAIVLTLLYYDQRIRREGYDVERMMQAAGLNPIAVELPGARPIPVALDQSPQEEQQA